MESDQWFRLRYSDGTEFFVDYLGSEIWCRWAQEATLEDVVPYLAGPILGFVLRLRGVFCLHSSAVAVNAQAIAFIGQAQAGKSSTAAAFAKLGYTALSDDIVALADCGNRFLAHPGYARLCLWPDVADILFGCLPRISPLGGISDWWDKRYVDLTANGRHFHTQPLPLAAIYFLDVRVGSPAAPRIEPFSAHDGLMHLVANTYMNYLLDSPMRASEFEILGRLISTVPVRRVIPHEDPVHLPALCEAVLADVATLVRRPGLSNTF